MSKRREIQRLRAAAEAGDVDCACALAAHLADDGDVAGAKHWYRIAADAGNLDAAVLLGAILEEGEDIPGADHWYRLAATAGDMDAAINLGTMLCKRDESFEEGVEWLKKAALSEDPENASFAAHSLGVEFIIEGDKRNLNEAERWFTIALTAGRKDAKKSLELIEAIRRQEAQDKAGLAGTGGDSETFEVTSVMFYDGIGHRLGPSLCTLTGTRLIIEDARGGMHQIPLRDVNSFGSPSRVISPSMLRINIPGAAYDIYCKSKDQKNQLGASISRAIRGA